MESAAEMGASVVGAWMRGFGCADVGNVLHRGGSGGSPLRVGVLGHVPAGWEGDGRISPLGDMLTGWMLQRNRDRT